MFRGASCSEGFQYKNPDGTPVDLTGIEVIFGITDVLGDTFKLTSGDAPTALGSFVEKTDEVDGRFRFFISDDETLTADLGTGRWWIQLDTGKMLWRDNIVVQDI